VVGSREADCQKLIKTVKDYPVLWQTDHSDYGKRGLIFSAWKAMGTIFEGNRVELEFSQVCKFIWKSLNAT